jgi:hypothetical protein
MNTPQATRVGRSRAGRQEKMLATKAPAATAGTPPTFTFTKSTRLRKLTSEEHRQVIAGAPYYRGLRWSL